MFAYCGNNAVNRSDPLGQYMVGVDILNRAGGFSGLPSNTTGGGDNTTCQDLSKKGISQGRESPTFSPGKRKPKELWKIAVRSYIELSSFSDTYPEVKIFEGVDDTIGGISTIKNGVALLFMPVPTCLEDLLGIGLCTLGVLQTIGGFVKTLVGFKEI